MCSGMDKLDTLQMNHNLLNTIEAGSFDGMPRLTSLELDYNKIASIDLEAFKGLEGNTLKNYIFNIEKNQLFHVSLKLNLKIDVLSISSRMLECKKERKKRKKPNRFNNRSSIHKCSN